MPYPQQEEVPCQGVHHACPPRSDWCQGPCGIKQFHSSWPDTDVELNVQIQSGKEVDLLQEWFENYWEESEEVTPELAEVVDRHVKLLPIHRVRQISSALDGRS